MLRKLTALATALIIFLSVPITAFAATGTITGYPHFRSAPSTQSKIYENLKNGQKVTVLEKVNTYWVKIRANGKTGYVSTKYIRIHPSGSKSSSGGKSKGGWTVSQRLDAILATAHSLLGTPYQFGATYEKNRKFDCSSFVQYVFRQHGTSLPRTTKEQAKMGVKVSKNNLRKGDLLFFTVRGGKSIGHVAIYAGNGKMIHTYGTGGVRYDSLNTPYWTSNFVMAKRIIR